MHEIGLCEGLVAAVERRAAGRPVAAVRFRVGVLHRVVEAALVQAFELVAAGTVADGATVDLVTLPVRVRCRACAAETVADDMVSVCGTCGTTDLDLVGGDELVLESITIAAPV
ncbi:MAG: hydrogenase expression/synthesis HypA [Mycobacterium sp.]|jgi:hydrogenase nickel incorporation protein HypA/HybF|nr:hydrogenase expression/synthesis HypA [Mycobacterium sp.]